MKKKEFLMKYDNKKSYGWVCYSATLNPPCVYTNVLSVGMTKKEAEDNAVKKYGKSISASMPMIALQSVMHRY